MEITLNEDNTISHGFYNGEHDEFKMINNAVLRFDFNSTYDNFMSIVEHVKPEFLRGALKRENHKDLFTDRHETVIHCDIVDIALVFKGYKPMCYIDDLPDFFNELNLFSIKIDKKYPKYIIYKDVLLKDRAAFLTKHIQELKEEDTAHHYIMGDYLGYPKEDVDYFVHRC